MKKDNVAEYGDLATNNLGHSLKVVNGFEIVTFGGKKVFDVRETIGQTARLTNVVADSATMFGPLQLEQCALASAHTS